MNSQFNLIRCPSLLDTLKRKKGNTMEIDIASIPVQIFENILFYVYDGKLRDLRSLELLELMIATKQFKRLDHLFWLCKSSLISQITLLNVSQILSKASKTNL